MRYSELYLALSNPQVRLMLRFCFYWLTPDIGVFFPGNAALRKQMWELFSFYKTEKMALNDSKCSIEFFVKDQSAANVLCKPKLRFANSIRIIHVD